MFLGIPVLFSMYLSELSVLGYMPHPQLTSCITLKWQYRVGSCLYNFFKSLFMLITISCAMYILKSKTQVIVFMRSLIHPPGIHLKGLHVICVWSSQRPCHFTKTDLNLCRILSTRHRSLMLSRLEHSLITEFEFNSTLNCYINNS